MNKMTKYTEIKQKTKTVVWERDNCCCIICGKPVGVFNANAHIVPRSKGGLGIEQNVVTLCIGCHYLLDQTVDRPRLMEYVKSYIKELYPDWDEEKMKYKKGAKYE